MTPEQRAAAVERNALRWIDNEPNWRAWEIEMTGRSIRARAANAVDNAKFAVSFWKALL